MLVIDEADYLLSYGFESDVRQIKEYLPKILQGFLMSATLSTVRSMLSFPLSNQIYYLRQDVQSLKELVLHSPVRLTLLCLMPSRLIFDYLFSLGYIGVRRDRRYRRRSFAATLNSVSNSYASRTFVSHVGPQLPRKGQVLDGVFHAEDEVGTRQGSVLRE